MDSFSLNNKKDFVKTISKSKIIERSYEKNKMPIKVILKPRNSLIYNDLVPNKEKTKQIMTNFFNPNLSKKSFETPKKINKEIHYYNSNPNRKVISLNSNSPNNYNDEDEKKIIIKNPVMNVLKYTFDTNSKRKFIKEMAHNKNSYELNNEDIDNKKANFLFSNYNNNKIKKSHKISSSMETCDIEFYKNEINSSLNDNHKKKISYFDNNNEFNDEQFIELQTPRYSISNYTNNSIEKNMLTNPILTESNSIVNLISKNKKNNILKKENKNYSLTENNELIKYKTNNNFREIKKKINKSYQNEIKSEENENENNTKKEISTTIIRIEDLIVLEEKFSNILSNFKNIIQLKKFCIEWWTFYNYCSFYNCFENFFSDSQIKEKNISHEYSVLEFLSIIVVHEVLNDNKINQSTLNCLNKLMFCVNQNFLIVCDYIISILPIYSKKSSWVQKLNLILEKKLETKIIKNHLDLLKTGNNNISILMKNILKLYTSNNKVNGNELLFYLSRSSRIFINTLNEYFKKKVNLDEYNINQNDLVKIESKNKNLNNKIPYLKNKKDKKKVFTLVLDLDETIISYQKGTFIPRPGLNKFLTEINKLYEIIVFTSATQSYADSILDSIDKNNIYFEKRLYRQHTVFINDTFVKDLSKLGRDLSKIIILDNRPQNYFLQKENGIFIRSFYGDNKYDNALINLIPILKSIAKNPYNDVRKELKKLSEEIFTKVTTDLFDGNYI